MSDGSRQTHIAGSTDASQFTEALSRLKAEGLPPAAVILDGVMQSDGVQVLTPEYVRDLWRRTHEAGARWIADEVQLGHGRTGDAMWSFQRFGIVPDFVTLGKPMGNGHPIAAVITRREFLRACRRDRHLLHGRRQPGIRGCRARGAKRPRRRARAAAGSGYWCDAARSRPRRHAGCVMRRRRPRGGLVNAIEIVDDNASKTPDPVTASNIKNAMKHNGVLIGTTGAAANVLKVRPPLAFTEREVPVFVDALVASLRGLA